MVTGREIKWGVVLSRHQSKHTKLDYQDIFDVYIHLYYLLLLSFFYILSRHQSKHTKLDFQVEKNFCPIYSMFIFIYIYFLFISFIYITRSYAAPRAADLEWMVGPGYSLGGYILEKTHEKPTWNHEKP